MDNLLAGSSPFNEFLVRNCLERSSAKIKGILVLRDLMIHHYPNDVENLPVDIIMKMEKCHNSDRIGITE